MPLVIQIRMSNQLYGGHNLPPLVGIGLTELPNSGWPRAHPAHQLTASLHIADISVPLPYPPRLVKVIKERPTLHCTTSSLLPFSGILRPDF